MQVKAAPRYSVSDIHARLAVFPPVQVKVAPHLTSPARLAVFPPMQVKVAPRYSTSAIPCSASSIPTAASQSDTTLLGF